MQTRAQRGFGFLVSTKVYLFSQISYNCSLNFSGISRSLSSLGRKLLRPGKHWEKTQEIAGFTYTAPAVSMRSALIACVVHMRRNEIDEALDSLIMLSITLGFEVTNGM